MNEHSLPRLCLSLFGAIDEALMNRNFSTVFLAALTMTAQAALAQTPTKMLCQIIGNAAPEPITEGRAVVVNNFSCRIEGGPLDKAIATASQVYDFTGSAGTGRAGYGVIRGSDGMAIYVNREMKADLQMTDGKVTGAKGSGSGSYTMATGSAKGLEGKPYDYTWS